jgi:hypothetical protein
MALRGFYNDNLSLPGRSSSGPEKRAAIAQVLHKGGAIRHIYDGLEGSTPLSSLEGRPGIEMAGIIATTVHDSLIRNPELNPNALNASSSFISRYLISDEEPQGLQ